jgi:type VI secretion system protein ImpL
MALLGLLAVALLIWFIGPLLAIADWEPLSSAFSRLFTIVVMMVLWGLNQLRKYLLARRKNDQLVESLAGAPEDTAQSAAAAEIAELKGRFEEALMILKKARLDHRQGHQFLYQLPWYIIIGPPGCGKTTALLNSGLHFPLAERFGKGEIQGVGGTRNCDWFFTDEAVLLDTAGRYATQDSHQSVDSAAWLGFLDLLKKYRRRRPINGVLIAVSIVDLMQHNDQERSGQALAIKQRIQELHQHLGIRFPVYVLFTKCDLLAGFTEFFSDLGQEERAQIWGMTLPLDDLESPRGVVESFAAEFDALEQRLNSRLVERLQQERDSRSRDLIYAFPQQFTALKGIADSFLIELFRPSRFEQRVLLRGVYFTSGTQEGTPIDRIVSTLAATFHLDRQLVPSFSGMGKSYFITRLLQNVIFQEAGLAGTNLRLEQQRAWLQWGAYAGTLLLTVLIAVAWFTSYLRNQRYINEVNSQLRTIEGRIQDLPRTQRDNDVISILPLLNAARNIPGGYQDRKEGTPLLMGFGLYQGDKLGTQAAIPAYQRLLAKVFLPRIMWRLEEQLRQGSDSAYLAQALKVYLMLNDPAHFDANTVRAWITLDWEHNLFRRITLEQRQALEAHLEALLEALPPLPFAQDEELIRRVRTRLLQISLAQRVYLLLQREQLGDKVPDFRISEAAGRDAPLVFIRKSGQPLSAGIPGLYTYAGYHKIFIEASRNWIKELVEENWILGNQAQIKTDPEEIERLSNEVRQLYLRDYSKRWEELLTDIDIRSLSNLRDSVALVNVLSGADSPVQKLLIAVDRETTLERPTEEKTSQEGKIAGEVVKQATSRVPGIDRLRQLFGQTTGPSSEGLVLTPPNTVDERFAPLHRLIQNKGLDAIRSLLTELYVYLDAIASAADQGGAALDAAKKQSGGVISKLKLEAPRQPAPVNRWLQTLAEDSLNLTVGGMRTHLNAVWAVEIQPACQQAINGRYPLIRDSPQEITLEDFGNFFGPGGFLDKYFQNYLQPFVDTSQNPWRWRSTGEAEAGVSAEALAQFQRADAIKKAFFQSGAKTPAVRFDLKPISMDAELSHFLLDLGGQQIIYRHGPARPKPMQWPSPEGASQVRIEFSPPSPNGLSGLTKDGPWAWFRLLDLADIKPTPEPERFFVTFTVDGRWARYELRASSAFNPFGRRQELEQFRCPPRL